MGCRYCLKSHKHERSCPVRDSDLQTTLVRSNRNFRFIEETKFKRTGDRYIANGKCFNCGKHKRARMGSRKLYLLCVFCRLKRVLRRRKSLWWIDVREQKE